MTLSVRSLEMSTQAIQLTVSTLAVSFGSVRAKQVQHVVQTVTLAVPEWLCSQFESESPIKPTC